MQHKFGDIADSAWRSGTGAVSNADVAGGEKRRIGKTGVVESHFRCTHAENADAAHASKAFAVVAAFVEFKRCGRTADLRAQSLDGCPVLNFLYGIGARQQLGAYATPVVSKRTDGAEAGNDDARLAVHERPPLI